MEFSGVVHQELIGARYYHVQAHGPLCYPPPTITTITRSLLTTIIAILSNFSLQYVTHCLTLFRVLEIHHKAKME